MGFLMSKPRIPHYEMCKIFKTIHDEKFDQPYVITTLDAKEAHEVWVLNGEIPEKQMRSFCAVYFSRSDFKTWQDMGFPAWQFFRHFNSFAPRVTQEAKPYLFICPRCQTEHP